MGHKNITMTGLEFVNFQLPICIYKFTWSQHCSWSGLACLVIILVCGLGLWQTCKTIYLHISVFLVLVTPIYQNQQISNIFLSMISWITYKEKTLITLLCYHYHYRLLMFQNLTNNLLFRSSRMYLKGIKDKWTHGKLWIHTVVAIADDSPTKFNSVLDLKYLPQFFFCL